MQAQLSEMDVVLETTRQHRRHMLQWVAQQWSYWRHTVSREQATLGTLNLLNFDISRKVFVAEGWVATGRLAEVRAALRRATIRTGSETEPILNVLETTKVLRVELGLAPTLTLALALTPNPTLAPTLTPTGAADAPADDALQCWLPGARGHLRGAEIPRDQPGRIRHRALPLSLRHHVRRRRPRRAAPAAPNYLP